MKLVNRRTVLGSALALAVVIFALDRLAGGGPRTADAAAPAVAAPLPRAGTAATPASSGAPPAGLAAPPAAEDVAELLRRIDADRGPVAAIDLEGVTRDPFVATTALGAATDGTGDAPAGPSASTQPAAAEVPFEKRHRLQGVVVGPVPLAVIDGQPYRMGEAIDGYTVIDIQREYAVLRGEASVVVLHLVHDFPTAAR